MRAWRNYSNSIEIAQGKVALTQFKKDIFTLWIYCFSHLKKHGFCPYCFFINDFLFVLNFVHSKVLLHTISNWGIKIIYFKSSYYKFKKKNILGHYQHPQNMKIARKDSIKLPTCHVFDFPKIGLVWIEIVT